MQFTEQIIVNNFYLFIRKHFEHPSLQHLGIPVHLAICTKLLGKSVEGSLAKLLLVQLEVRLTLHAVRGIAAAQPTICSVLYLQGFVAATVLVM